MHPIYDIFEDLEIEWRLIDHPHFFTCEESEKWYAKNVNETMGMSKNIFLRDRKGETHYLVVLESHKRLDLKELADKLGESNLSFASPERLKKYLDLTPGSVSPFALIHENAKEVIVMLDEDLLKHEQLHYHPPGRNDQTILLSREDFKKFLDRIPNSVQFNTF